MIIKKLKEKDRKNARAASVRGRPRLLEGGVLRRAAARFGDVVGCLVDVHVDGRRGLRLERSSEMRSERGRHGEVALAFVRSEERERGAHEKKVSKWAVFLF